MFSSLRCGQLAAIFALCLTGCADLLEGDLAAGLVQLVASERFAGLLPAGHKAPGVLVLWQGGSSLAPEG